MNELTSVGVLIGGVFALLSVLLSRESVIIGIERDRIESKFLVLESFTKAARETCFNKVIGGIDNRNLLAHECAQLVFKENEAKIRLNRDIEYEKNIIREMVVIRSLILNMDEKFEDREDLSNEELKYRSDISEKTYRDLGYRKGETLEAFIVRKLDGLDYMVNKNDELFWGYVKTGGGIKRWSDFLLGMTAGGVALSMVFELIF